MLHGKRGFDRLVYAAKKVLNQPMTWLFCNIRGSSKFLSLSPETPINNGQAQPLTRWSSTFLPDSPRPPARWKISPSEMWLFRFRPLF